MENIERKLAEEFILNTGRNIFLTGKAGTGKTTLLSEIIKLSTKRTVVVAPTGVAAINAGGVTIHSMFQLPTSTFIPVHQAGEDPDHFTDQSRLASNQRIRKERRQLFLELDLLIIDEISMVRADLLDAVDFTLKRIRKNRSPFGGVQVLAIGDLFQLAPVVRPHESSVLRNYYSSRFFFDSKVWHACDPLKIELKIVYRQEEESFINILNNIRNGIRHEQDLELLNSRFEEEPDTSETITLTTHNRKADSINQNQLAKLSTVKYTLKAEVSGRFSESSYPTNEKIILKKGAQVMFIRNHTDGEYYNGKIGKVTGMVDEILIVKCEDQKNPISVSPIEWKNIRYSVDKDTKDIKQEEVGKFTQYPLKLAWAVTVHKSQGLTFDKAILDLENTFAAGQLYVALSRCRTISGMTLSSKIQERNIIVDQRIVQYHQHSTLDPNINEILARDKRLFEDRSLLRAFDFSRLLALNEFWRELILDSDIPQQADAILLNQVIMKLLNQTDNVSVKFQRQLTSLLAPQKVDSVPEVMVRSSKAIEYFSELLYPEIISPLEDHLEIIKIKKGTKKYSRELSTFIDECWNHLNQLYRLTFRNQDLHPNKPKYIRSKKTGTSKNNSSGAKEGTHDITLTLYEGGMSIEEIAEARILKIGTVRTHFSKWIESGKVSIVKLMDKSRMEKLYSHYRDNVALSSSELKNKIPFETEWYELRWITAHHKWVESQSKDS